MGAQASIRHRWFHWPADAPKAIDQKQRDTVFVVWSGEDRPIFASRVPGRVRTHWWYCYGYWGIVSWGWFRGARRNRDRASGGFPESEWVAWRDVRGLEWGRGGRVIGGRRLGGTFGAGWDVGVSRYGWGGFAWVLGKFRRWGFWWGGLPRGNGNWRRRGRGKSAHFGWIAYSCVSQIRENFLEGLGIGFDCQS